MWLFLFLLAVAAAKTETSDDSVILSCDFEEGTCGLTNEDDLQSQWVRKKVDLAGKNGYVMMVESRGNGSIARLLTPYLGFNGDTKRCLRFDHYQDGKGAVVTYVHYQDETGFETLASLFLNQDKWRHLKFNAVIEEYSRIIFEGHNYPENGPGTIAIDNIEYRQGGCP